MNNIFEQYPKLVKEFITNEYSLKVEKHKEFYVVSYNGDSFAPTTNLTVALSLFDTLAQAHMN